MLICIDYVTVILNTNVLYNVILRENGLNTPELALLLKECESVGDPLYQPLTNRPKEHL